MKSPNAKPKFTPRRFRRTKNHRLRPFVKIRIGGRPTKTNTGLKIAIKINNKNRITNPGGKVQATILTRTGRRAFSARDKVTAKKSAASVKKPTSLVWTPTVVRSGPRSTPRRPTRLTTWTSPLSRSRIFSKELDGTPTSSSSSHSSADFEFVCHLCCDIQ